MESWCVHLNCGAAQTVKSHQERVIIFFQQLIPYTQVPTTSAPHQYSKTTPHMMQTPTQLLKRDRGAVSANNAIAGNILRVKHRGEKKKNISIAKQIQCRAPPQYYCRVLYKETARRRQTTSSPPRNAGHHYTTTLLKYSTSLQHRSLRAVTRYMLPGSRLQVLTSEDPRQSEICVN